MKIIFRLTLVLFFLSCETGLEKWKLYDQKAEISKSSLNENKKLQYKRIQLFTRLYISTFST